MWSHFDLHPEYFKLKQQMIDWEGGGIWNWNKFRKLNAPSGIQHQSVEVVRFILFVYRGNSHLNLISFSLLLFCMFGIKKVKSWASCEFLSFFKGWSTKKIATFLKLFPPASPRPGLRSQQVLPDLHFTKNTSQLLEGNPSSLRTSWRCSARSHSEPLHLILVNKILSMWFTNKNRTDSFIILNDDNK